MRSSRESPDPSLAFLSGGGELGERLRGFDWSNNPLGPPSGWSQSLKTVVRIMLTSGQAYWVAWGPELIYLYNDPYRAIVGGKHPEALGKPIREVWREILDTIDPMLEAAMTGDKGTYVESQRLIMERHGYREETYYTFSYSPIPDDRGETGGLLCANTDDTARVIGDRQQNLLREIVTRTSEARSWKDAARLGILALTRDELDLPFAALYTIDQNGQDASLFSVVGLPEGHDAAPAELSLNDTSWPIARAIEGKTLVLVEGLGNRFDSEFPLGEWGEPPHHGAILPIQLAGRGVAGAVLVVGLNPYRRLDSKYERFLWFVASQLETSMASADAYEQERRRAESLSELDRAKTRFFSNVSHEFRTPLTLMLGPLEDLLTQGESDVSESAKGQIRVVQRNSLRLLKLVNTMLDFSRIEGGRMRATFEPTSLCERTVELASVFRSTVERAGIELSVRCLPLSEPVYVDPEMWEKIVLNLLSNAFKFTMSGTISVELKEDEDVVRLVVADTGVGIPKEEWENVFERFHRVPEVRGRTYEGTGIGLSLVRELVGLHRGRVYLDSSEGEGSRFIVEIPKGREHLDPAAIRKVPSESWFDEIRTDAFVHEARHWLPGGEGGSASNGDVTKPEFSVAGEITSSRRGNASVILLADDNSDMRTYISRILSERFQVVVAEDGKIALEMARRRKPDLLLTDVMMPKLDGFGLLKAFRKDPSLRDVPVIMLSARAGEEARVEGVEAGADDYLIKPFTARELVARVSAHLRMLAIRRKAQRSLRKEQESLTLALETGRLGSFDVDLVSGEVRCNAQAKLNFGYAPDVELSQEMLWSRIHPEDVPRVQAIAQRVREDRSSYEVEYRVIWPDESVHWLFSRGRVVGEPDDPGLRLLSVAFDITDRKVAEQQLEASEQRFREMADTAPAMLWITEADGRCSFLSRGWYEFTGQTPENALGWGWLDALHPEDRERSVAIFRGASERAEGFSIDCRIRQTDGSYRWTIAAGRPRLSKGGRLLGYIGSVIDMHDRKKAEEALLESDQRKDEFLATLAHELRNPLAPLRSGIELIKRVVNSPELVSRTQLTMERQVTHMVRLVDDLLDVNRISQGKIELKLSRVSLNDIAEGAIEVVTTQAERAGLGVAFLPSEEPAFVMGDPDRLQQILSNLLSNACKFTPHGGEVTLRIQREGSKVIVRVSDTGVGIPEEQVESIFEMFTQVKSARGDHVPMGDGLGIGLTLVKRLVKLHGGEVTARSEGCNKGSHFTIVLPASDDPGGRKVEPLPLPREIRTCRILVVDDNEDAAEILAELLRCDGHEVREANDGPEALSIAELFRPDVMLFDIGLPIMDGHELCRQVRRRPWGTDALVIALTGWGQERDRRLSSQAGFDHHLVKPVDISALKELLVHCAVEDSDRSHSGEGQAPRS